MDEPGDPTQMLAASPVYTAPQRLRGTKPEPASDLFHSVRRCSLRLKANRHSMRRHCSTRSLRLPRANRAPLLHAGPLRPVIDGLLANNPAERLTGERARMALLDVQQHKHRLRAGSAEREEQLRCWVLELDDETLQEFA